MSGVVALPLPSTPARRTDVNRLVLGGGFALLAGLLAAVVLQPHNSWRMPALVLVGAAIGAVLLRSAFGFAGAFRALIGRDWMPSMKARARARVVEPIDDYVKLEIETALRRRPAVTVIPLLVGEAPEPPVADELPPPAPCSRSAAAMGA